MALAFKKIFPLSVAKIAYQPPSDLHLVKDTDIFGGRAYYFIRVNRLKLPQFLRVMKTKQPVKLDDYGEIIFSAYGDHPSPAVIQKMREEHGWQG